MSEVIEEVQEVKEENVNYTQNVVDVLNGLAKCVETLVEITPKAPTGDRSLMVGLTVQLDAILGMYHEAIEDVMSKVEEKTKEKEEESSED
tara:strand:- start:2967 stop:3239 length:273 start_codon:yes stop_codon:yes gene_type:complete